MPHDILVFHPDTLLQSERNFSKRCWTPYKLRRISLFTRQKLNLTPEELIEEMKIQAVKEKRPFSVIVEELCREYLDRQVKVKLKTKSK